MKINKGLTFFFFLFLVGCNSPEAPPMGKKETFAGRHGGKAIYHAEVPLHWKRLDSTENLTDTKIPITAYEIDDALLTIHNFPYTSLETRIPPEAQIQRWEQQIPDGVYDVTKISHGGFGGFRLEAHGNKSMIAYAMQLTPAIFRALPASEIDMRADYTLKFMGTAEAIEKNREDIDAFAQSFEWILPVAFEKL